MIFYIIAIALAAVAFFAARKDHFVAAALCVFSAVGFIMVALTTP